MIEVKIPELSGAEKAAWDVVLDLADAGLPRWCWREGSWCICTFMRRAPAPCPPPPTWMPIVDISVGAERATEAFSRRLEDDLHVRMTPSNAASVGHRFTRADGAVVDVLA